MTLTETFANFFDGRRVLVTGHTGFKGSWLSLWLHTLGARVTGYALDPPTDPNLFQLCRIDQLVHSIIADIRDLDALRRAMQEAAPEIVIHMAAQPLVRDSYTNPVETYEINVMGTVNVLEAIRTTPTVRAVVVVTTDKCYENHEWVWGYRENEPLGGYDPYSSSKACAELVTAAYRRSFFNSTSSSTQQPFTLHSSPFTFHAPAIATARAGNVIGGGDWGKDRLVPDCIRALLKGEKIAIRDPSAIRPWQHVLEPLAGYLVLAQRLFQDGPSFAEAWNFGPHDADARPVEWLVRRLCEQWGEGASYEMDTGEHPHEAHYLKLDCSKAEHRLGWHPRWDLAKAIESLVQWAKAYQRGDDLRAHCIKEIAAYMNV